MGKIVGYVRVSSKDQNADRQMDEMEKRGVLRKHIYLDQKSGCNFERPSYRKMIREIRKGDLILIKSIDRLGRNYREVIEQWQLLTRDKGVDVRVLDMPLLDTTIAKDLLGTFISNLVLQLLSFVAQNERENIHQRQSEGIRAARLRGVKFGRPSKFLAGDRTRAQIIQEWRAHRITAAQAGAALGVSRRTLYRWLDKGVLMQPNKQLK